MLPLAEGLPVAMTDHIDRNPEKNLLKGRVCYVDSWILDDHEDSVFENGRRILRRAPKAVLVQYYDVVERNKVLVEEPCSWIIDGINRPGVYPVRPWRRSWFLDQHGKTPMLEIKRLQVPLAPAYAMTAHGAQCRTLLAAIVDLKLGRGVSAIASYIALTRVRSCSDMLIFRDFDREPFCQGPPEGPTLLLKSLRREHIDWAEIERAHTPQIQCHGPCLTVRFKEDLFAREVSYKRDAYCEACVKRMAEQ